MSKSSNSFIAFLIGLMTGAVMGILYAPNKGSDTREILTQKLSKYKIQLQNILQEMRNKSKTLRNNSNVKQEEEVLENTENLKKAEDFILGIDDFIEEINKNKNK
ncbi:MAG: YtxH domain-containing protein [Chitinophagaceae bacterium]|nr:YtxH domain-containing protein [Chitinophagaceae bacterium]